MSGGFPAFAPPRPRTVELGSFFARVNVQPGGCWFWTGAVGESGYGVYKGTSAHRWTYGWFVEPIACDHEVDHLCRNRRCVNPAHGESVTGIENRRRANRFDTTGRCRRGHQLAECGVGTNGAVTDRICKGCRRLRQARYLQSHGVQLPDFAVVALAQERMREAIAARRLQRVAS